MFPQGATPTFVLTLPEGWDLTLANKVIASFRCSGTQYDIVVPIEQLTPTTATVQLTQEQTLAWAYRSDLKVQLNWIFPNGVRIATSVWQGKIDEQLLMEVMS